MSLYKRPGSQEWSYDFVWRGHRFSGATRESDKSKAKAFERAEKERIKTLEVDKTKPLRFGRAATLWWSEAGQFHRNIKDSSRSLAWLQKHIGENTLLKEIGDAKVAALVAIRRADGVSNATVNRQVVEPLRGIMIRARDVWDQDFKMPVWKRHTLKEPRERVREMTSQEEALYFSALRRDYHPVMRFALLSGCRLDEIVKLEWRDIDWRTRKLVVTGKGDKSRDIPLSNELLALLRPLPRAHAKVFTYEAQTAVHAPRGSRQPITYEGVKITHRRTIAKSGVEGFRFHDFRHTAATRLIRSAGNIKHVQKLLGHEDIATTSRYANVNSDDLLNAMNKAEVDRKAAERPETDAKEKGDE